MILLLLIMGFINFGLLEITKLLNQTLCFLIMLLLLCEQVFHLDWKPKG